MGAMTVSVALAAYNGEKYLADQIASVLPQLGAGDEIIISDDLPGGGTQKVAEFYAAYDRRVTYIQGPGRGVCRNFENAVRACSGELVFLCDQDDVWLPGKVDKMKKEFEKGAKVVLHDAKVTDENLRVTAESYFALHKSRTGFLSNFIRNSYVGCCMAFTSDFRNIILPFPEGLPMHDWWIGLLGELWNCVGVIEEPLILYRRHSGTVTGSGSTAAQKLVWRANMAASLAGRVFAGKINRGGK